MHPFPSNALIGELSLRFLFFLLFCFEAAITASIDAEKSHSALLSRKKKKEENHHHHHHNLSFKRSSNNAFFFHLSSFPDQLFDIQGESKEGGKKKRTSKNNKYKYK